jgi:indolepyruvate ferredoxin oxidoreductase beta subunit
VINGQENTPEGNTFIIDADALAKEINNPKSVNLIMLGFALKSVPDLFCTPADIRKVIQMRLKAKPEMMETALSALEAGSIGR